MNVGDNKWPDMTADELAAWNGLLVGELEALADALEPENGRLHPVLQRTLVRMIRGGHELTDFRLKVSPHPDLRHGRQSRNEKAKERAVSWNSAVEYVRHGGMERGQGGGA